MIDEKELIEKIEKMVIPLSTPDGSESIDIGINGYNECLVDVLETIKAQPKVGEWIPVKDRLPEEKKFYEENMRSPACLVTVLSDDELMVDIDRTVNGVWVIEELFGKPKIIAWRPLQEPFSSED